MHALTDHKTLNHAMCPMETYNLITLLKTTTNINHTISATGSQYKTTALTYYCNNM